MTRDETSKLLAAMAAIYPNFRAPDPVIALDMWHRILCDDNGRQVMDAFNVYARTDTSGFAPSPGQLRRMIQDRLTTDMTDGEIIGLLSMASRNANYGYEDEFAKLPPALQKAVGSPAVIRNWGQMESSQLDFAFGRIIRSYRLLKSREQQDHAAIGTTLDAKELTDKTAAMLGDYQDGL